MKRIFITMLFLASATTAIQSCDWCCSSSQVTAADDHEPVVTQAALNRVLPTGPEQQGMDQVSAGSAAQPAAQFMPEQPKRAAVGAGQVQAGAGLLPGALLTDSPRGLADPRSYGRSVYQQGLFNFSSSNVTINNNGLGLQAGATARRGSFVQTPQPQVGSGMGAPAGSSAGAAGSNNEPDAAPEVSVSQQSRVDTPDSRIDSRLKYSFGTSYQRDKERILAEKTTEKVKKQKLIHLLNVRQIDLYRGCLEGVVREYGQMGLAILDGIITDNIIHAELQPDGKLAQMNRGTTTEYGPRQRTILGRYSQAQLKEAVYLFRKMAEPQQKALEKAVMKYLFDEKALVMRLCMQERSDLLCMLLKVVPSDKVPLARDAVQAGYSIAIRNPAQNVSAQPTAISLLTSGSHIPKPPING